MKKLLIGTLAYALLASGAPTFAMQQVRGEQCINCHTRRSVPCQRPVRYARRSAQPVYFMPIAAPVMAVPQTMCRPFFGFGASINLPFFGFGFHLGL